MSTLGFYSGAANVIATIARYSVQMNGNSSSFPDPGDAVGNHDADTINPVQPIALEHRAKKWAPVFGVQRCDNKDSKHRAKKWAPFGIRRCDNKNLERADDSHLALPALAHAASAGSAPPHLLWETLESAFAGLQSDAQTPQGSGKSEDEPLARYISLPITLALSLVLWVVIVALVLRR